MRMTIQKWIGSAAALLLLLTAFLVLPTVLRVSAEDSGTSTGEHTVTVKVNENATGGTIKWFSVSGTLKVERESGEKCGKDATICIEATPNTGYKLTKIVCVEDSREYTQGESWTYEPVTKSVTFEAYFEPKQYSVVELTSEPAGVPYSFKVGETVKVGDQFSYGSSVVLPIPQIDTYVFKKWVLNGSMDLTDNTLPLNVDYKDGIRLTAVFEPKKYTVTVIDVDDATNELIGSLTTFEWPYNELVKVDGSMTLPIDLPTRDGYTYDSATDGRKVRVSETENVFYRRFKPNTYTVRLDNGNAAATGGKESLTVDFNRPFGALATSELPTLSGYRFAGYFDKPNGMGKQYIDANGQAFSENGKEVRWELASNDGVLYAHWIPNDYALSFDNALTASGAVITVTQGNTVYTYNGTPLSFPYGTVVSITVRAADGYKLVSWNGEAILHTTEKTVSFTIPAQDSELTGRALPVCQMPAFRADYINEVLTVDGGIPAGNYVLRVGTTEYAFTGDGAAVSLANYFGTTVYLLCKGDGTVTADSDWVTLVLTARPEQPGGESGLAEKPSITENSVTFTMPDDGVIYEYAYALRATDKLIWQDTGAFADLKPGTTYLFYIRVRATETAPHGELLLVTVNTLNENYLKGKIEELRGNQTNSDGQNVSELIAIYVAKMEALQPSANYEYDMEALIAECRSKLALARAKDAAIAEIERSYAELVAGNQYNEDGKETLKQLCETAVSGVNSAVTTAGVETAKREFEAGVAEIPVRIDLSRLFLALGVVLLLQVITLAILLTRRAKYADRVRYARGTAAYGSILPVYALTAYFLPVGSTVLALCLGLLALILQIVIMVLIFRSVALIKHSQKPDANTGAPADRAMPKGDETEADPFAFQPQVSVFGEDAAPTFEHDAEEALQEEDWYDDVLDDGEKVEADRFEPDDSTDD